MPGKQFKAIMLVWVLLSQPLLSLAFTSSSTSGIHDHSSHDHFSVEHNAFRVVPGTHHDITTHTESIHEHHTSTKVMSMHNCGPCLNGDMSHCQCHVVMHMELLIAIGNYSVFEPVGYYAGVLAAHDQSLIRPPIFA